jgi:NADH dehydrogenase FAD-containing subunit
VVLGTGWGGARLARDIDTSKYDLTVVSPRNHMVFTPLLGALARDRLAALPAKAADASCLTLPHDCCPLYA